MPNTVARGLLVPYSPQVASPPFVAPAVWTPSGTVRGRAYCFHGFNDSPSNFFSSSPFGPSTDSTSLVGQLLANGWQVVALGESYDIGQQATQGLLEFKADPGHGSRFANNQNTLLIKSMAYVDSLYGPAVDPNNQNRPLLVGVSWGGLAVELLAESGLSVRGWVAHLPATDPAVMTEYFGLSSRTDICTTTSGSPVVIDASSTAADTGKSITGPAGSGIGGGVPPVYIGTWSANVDGLGHTGFRLSSSMDSQVDFNATGGATNVGLFIGGLAGLHPASPILTGNAPGWISWATADSRVGYQATQRRYTALNALNANVQGVTYAGQSHSTIAQNITDMMTFISALP